MKQKRFLGLSLVLGSALLFTTAFASAASVWTIDTGLVKKTLTVGTNSNKGQLLVKGFIRNPVKGKKVYIKDHLKVQGNVKVGGILQGSNIVGADNLGTGVVTNGKIGEGAVTGNKIASETITSGNLQSASVTGDKMDFSMDGVVKAAAYINTSTPSTPTAATQFNKLANGTTITPSYNSTAGRYTVDFGATTNISSNYFNVTPLISGTSLFAVIRSVGTTSVTIDFYDDTGAGSDPTGFYLTVY
ncbi:MAG: hypothetical protein WC663_02810 [Patescibacteria group bacterium]|jgi:hypothetical protein